MHDFHLIHYWMAVVAQCCSGKKISYLLAAHFDIDICDLYCFTICFLNHYSIIPAFHIGQRTCHALQLFHDLLNSLFFSVWYANGLIVYIQSEVICFSEEIDWRLTDNDNIESALEWFQKKTNIVLWTYDKHETMKKAKQIDLQQVSLWFYCCVLFTCYLRLNVFESIGTANAIKLND